MPESDNGQDKSLAEKTSSVDVLERSVISPASSAVAGDGYILWVAQLADEILPWGKSPKARDRQLRQFFPTENFLNSALGIVASRNAAFSWTLEGGQRTSKVYQDILENACFGGGWQEFIVKFSIDLLTQDSGAFVELIRQTDSETSPVVGINHLDAGHCWPTGNAETPVIYVDRLGKMHGLKTHQIVNLHEMPSPVEHPQFGPLYKLQYCAVTRLLRAAQVLRNITIYKEEKTGGRFNRAIYLVKGITPKQIEDALAKQKFNADNMGLMRYLQPLLVGTVSPTADVGHDTIELATLPDGFDEEVTFKHYISAIAMAFLSDYQEFAPLPGGGLGTSAQSYILHLKSRGKGPALFQKLMSRLINEYVLPDNVEFHWDEQDVQAETEQAALEKTRAETRKLRIESGEITPEVARQIAKDEGDLAPEIFDALGGADLTPHVTLQDQEKPEVESEKPPVQPQLAAPAQPPEEKPPAAMAAKALEEIEDERLEAEDLVKELSLRALRRMKKRVVARLRTEE